MTLALANDVLDSVYEELGVEARFTSKDTGAAVNVLLLPDQGDGLYSGSGFDVTAERTVFNLRRSEAAIVKRGDIITMPREGGVDYKVNAAPRLLDIQKLEWTLELDEVTA